MPLYHRHKQQYQGFETPPRLLTYRCANIYGMDENKDNYIPAQVGKDTFDLTEFHRFNLKQFKFLEEYSKDLDHARAAKEVGIQTATANKWLNQDAFKQELMAIHEVWRKNIKMSSAHASAKLLDLMQKFEDDYDMMEAGDKSKMANALMKGADSYLRATGQYAQKEESGGTNIVVNIDLSGDLKPRDVTHSLDEDVIDQ